MVEDFFLNFLRKISFRLDTYFFHVFNNFLPKNLFIFHNLSIKTLKKANITSGEKITFSREGGGVEK